MQDRLAMLKIKLKISSKAIWELLQNYKYALFALLIAIAFFELMYWLFNIEVLRIIMFSSNVSLSEKLDVIISPIEAIGAASGSFVLIEMIILSLLQGLNIAAITYIIRHQQKVDAKLVGGGSVVGVLALIGLGCPACGTSLLTPIIAVFASSSAVAISETITEIALPIAISLSIYGLYILGQRLATVQLQNNSRVISDAEN